MISASLVGHPVSVETIEKMLNTRKRKRNEKYGHILEMLEEAKRQGI